MKRTCSCDYCGKLVGKVGFTSTGQFCLKCLRLMRQELLSAIKSMRSKR